ncbi:hypothetical protein R6Q57_003197 [Mikania cordata]
MSPSLVIWTSHEPPQPPQNETSLKKPSDLSQTIFRCERPHRFSGKITSNDVALKTFSKPWDKQFNSIEEEGLLDDDDESEKRIPRRCYVLGFIICFLILFSLFALILYGASKPQKPKVMMRSITFERFVVQAGSDFAGVATDMVTMNSTVKFSFRNTAAFFGLHNFRELDNFRFETLVMEEEEGDELTLLPLT